MNSLRKWLRLTAKDRRLVLQMFWLLASIRIGLKLLRLRTVQRMLDQRAAKSQAQDPLPLDTNRTRWAIEMVGLRLLKDGPCLTQALAMQFVLKRSNLPANLCIGVAKDDDGRLLAHAWIESEGRIVIGGSEQELKFYTRLPTLE